MYDKFEPTKLNGTILIHCKTEEAAKHFLNMMHECGWKWKSLKPLTASTNWRTYKANTYYTASENMTERIVYGNICTLVHNGCEIIVWDNYMKQFCQ